MKWTNVEVEGNRYRKEPLTHRLTKSVSLSAESLSQSDTGGNQWQVSKGLVLATDLAEGDPGDIDSPLMVVAGPHGISKGLSLSGESDPDGSRTVVTVRSLSKGLRLSGEDSVRAKNSRRPSDFLISKGLSLSSDWLAS